jgi:hypothetical protein
LPLARSTGDCLTPFEDENIHRTKRKDSMPAPLLKSTEIQTTIRKPLSWPMLICHANEWQVCYKAKGKLDWRTVIAWVYGRESIFFCEVGQEQHVVDLPDPKKVPFFDTNFTFTVDEINEDGFRFKELAGAENIVAANAAYQVYRHNCSGIVRLRHGGRLVRRSDFDR